MPPRHDHKRRAAPPRAISDSRPNVDARDDGRAGVPLTAIGADVFIGISAASRQIVETIKRVAPLDSSVLVRGESGVGKGLVARLLHAYGSRPRSPFVTVRCGGALTETLPSTLHAQTQQLYFAGEGTLFLDEVADVPLDVQPMLLGFLQDYAFQPIVSPRGLPLRVRLIASTHRDVKQLCAEKRFRQDLFFRLSVVPIVIPPLRERREDILPLALHLLDGLSRRLGRRLRLAPRAERALTAYHWPGNVRELDNVLHRSAAFAHGNEIGPADLPLEISRPAMYPKSARLAGMALKDIERLAIRQTLDACDGDATEAARRLGLSPRGIRLKIKRLGL